MHPFRLVLICREMTRPAQVRNALGSLPPAIKRQIHLTAVTPSELDDDGDRIASDLRAADLVLLSHILVDDDARRIKAQLDRHLSPDAQVLAMNSLRSVLLSTRLGSLQLSELASGKASAGPTAFVGRLMQAEDMTTALRELRTVLPTVLPRMPAGDLRSYLEAVLYWAESTPENIANLLLMLFDRYGAAPGSVSHLYAEPKLQPSCGLYHPDCGIVEDLADLPPSAATASVGLLLMRGAVLANETEPAIELIRAFEGRGIRVVASFSESFDFRPSVERYFDPSRCRAVISMTGFPLVGGHNRCEADTAAEFLAQRGIPYFTPPGLMVQDVEDWERSRLGLSPMEVAMELAIHEMEGGIEPVVLQGSRRNAGRISIPDRLPRFVDRVDSWLKLAEKKNRDKKILITVFSFPPGKGSVGTAAYLDVMCSTYALLERLRDEGYDVLLPESPEELLERIVVGDDKTAPIFAASLAVGARLTVADYERYAESSARVEKMWGPPPGALNTDGREFLIHGVDLGGVFVGVQPSFGYEGDPMRLLFDKGATPHHGFLAYYTWAEKVFRADAMVQVGTHGALEFMPGKQTGLSHACWPDLLAGTAPNLYLYAINNPSEGTIAKRRGNAVTIGHLTPPLDVAGLYAELSLMKDMIGSIRSEPDANRKRRMTEALEELVQKHNLDEVGSVTGDADLDRFLSTLYVVLTEIETRRIPVGLHTVGRAPTFESRLELLTAIAEHDRPEENLAAVSTLVFESRGLDVNERRASARRGQEDAVRDIAAITEAARGIVAAAMNDGVELAMVTAERAFPGIDGDRTRALLTSLIAVDERVRTSDELAPVIKALSGRYVQPGPGGDPVRAPRVVPTGRNLHALDPASVPSPAAMRQAEHMVELLLERTLAEHGRFPKSVGMVLWGLDNIKSHGEAIAQAFLLMGVRPRANSIGRMTELEIIPLSELDRPRIDVVLQTSGIFRDIFGLQIEMLDRAARLVSGLAEPDELNYVKARSDELVRTEELSESEARTRVFSNSPGAYGTNIDHMVNLSTWEHREDLARIFAKRKGFAYGERLEGERAEKVLTALARGVDTTFQNLDSSEVSVTDVDHYFEYLGGFTALVEAESGHRPLALMADATSAQAKVRALDETVRLEIRTKLLNPKWYEGLLAHGYEGVEEIKKRLEYTFGWSATCEAVDAWVYREVHRTYVEDEKLSHRMRDANLHAYTAMVKRLIEADARGFWAPTDDERAKLRDENAAVEDAIEGIA